LNDTVNIPAGSLAALSIGGVHLTHYFNANSFSGSWCRLDAAQQLDLGHMTIKVVDTLNNTGSGNTGDLHLVINPALTYPSIADTLAVTIYNSDGVTPSARNFFGDNFFQQNMTYVGTANVHNSLASILKWDGTLSNGGGLFSSAIPTAGFWKIGQTVWQLNPTSAGTPGWRCTASGTPATWRLMVPLLNGSGGFSVSGGINSTPVGTTTPSSGAFTTLSSTGPITLAKPGTVTGPTYSQAVTDSSLIFNGTATQAVTLISPASCSGQILYVKNVTAFALASASANVVPLGSMTAGTAILAATAGKFAMLQSDGTNWVTMMAN
jgi:hypothetical protein